MDLMKQSLGIDISKQTFTVCLCQIFTDQSEKLSEVKEFNNDKQGFNQLLRWVKKVSDRSKEIHYVMEATGVYFEPLAYHLHGIKKKVHVLLPNMVSHFGKSLNVKTKTDQDDAKVIAVMGCQRQLWDWKPPSLLFKKLRAYCRLYKTLQHDKVQTINRLKQLECSHEPLPEALKIHKASIKRIEKQHLSLDLKMEGLLKSDAEVWSKVEKLLTIKGVGIKTIAIVLGETQGFALIKNQRQLVSYCGYDVVQRESGTSIKGKTRISKKGNSNVRSALHFPAMVATRYNPLLRQIYHRIIKDKPSKMIGLIAIQRRLLVLIYTLWKKDEVYKEPSSESETSGFQEEEVPSSSSTQRVDRKFNLDEVEGVLGQPSTQNEHLYDQSSDVLLRQT